MGVTLTAIEEGIQKMIDDGCVPREFIEIYMSPLTRSEIKEFIYVDPIMVHGCRIVINESLGFGEILMRDKRETK